MKQKDSNATRVKLAVEVEAFVRWTFRDEMPKRNISAAEGIWNRIEDNRHHGGIDPGHGAAQRYAHHGLPHPDAEVMFKAVEQLQPKAIDWAASIDAIAPDLKALVRINDLTRPPSMAKQTNVGWGRAGDRALRGMFGPGAEKPLPDRRRDMLLVETFRPDVLVASHAQMANRPTSWDETPWPMKIMADKGKHAKVDGNCEGKNKYSLGSSCPLQYLPSAESVIRARAEYCVWWEGLNDLVETLELVDHILLPPSAPALPWFGETDEVGKVIVRPSDGATLHLPLTPTRGRMLSPFRRRAAGPVHHLVKDGNAVTAT